MLQQAPRHLNLRTPRPPGLRSFEISFGGGWQPCAATAACHLDFVAPFPSKHLTAPEGCQGPACAVRSEASNPRETRWVPVDKDAVFQ